MNVQCGVVFVHFSGSAGSLVGACCFACALHASLPYITVS